MKIIITESQLNEIKNLMEGKKATIYHKAAVGTTNPEYFTNNTYDNNVKKISLKNYLRLPGNRLVQGKSIIFNMKNEKFTYLETQGRKVTMRDENGNNVSGLIDNLFIIP